MVFERMKKISYIEESPSLDGELKDGTSLPLLARYLYRQAEALGWFDSPSGKQSANDASPTCVAIQNDGEGYFIEPVNILMPLHHAINRLSEAVIVSVASEIVSNITRSLNDEQPYLQLPTGTRIPIVASLDFLSASLASASQACIVKKEGILLIWGENPDSIIDDGSELEQHLLRLLFNHEMTQNRTLRFSAPRLPRYQSIFAQGRPSIYDRSMSMVKPPYEADIAEEEIIPRGGLDEKQEVYVKAIKVEEGEVDDEEDLEGQEAPARPVARIHQLKIAIVIMLVILSQSLGVKDLIREWCWDGGLPRFAILFTIPPLACFSLFFFIILTQSALQFLPVGNITKNTKYHSAIKPKHSRYRNYELPHITVQMPVYKEGLRSVIVPTMISVMAAIQHYESQGGTASVFVNDDGMQAIEPELAEARKQYYRENGIGYTARLPNKKSAPVAKKEPWYKRLFKATAKKNGTVTTEGAAITEKDVPETSESAEIGSAHTTDEEERLTPQQLANKIGFVRKGKFKKASNMNSGLLFSCRVEDELLRLMREEAEKRAITVEQLTIEEEEELYEVALDNMLEAEDGRIWADGNIRIGELILIIDCDTRVPIDCLLYGALEMHESPEVGILQHGSGVMQVVHNMFENGITYFTDIVYTSIKYGVGCGDVAPFVGHNAFLRWKAIQSVAFVDEEDGITKVWSESHVSEDFDIALRVQMAGMTVRLATYHNGDFKEGVSLTVYDELTRWEKYAYGCSELVFHPFDQWLKKGPVTRLFLRFLWSNMPVTSKVSIIAYIMTYYAIGSGFFLSFVNYIVIGLFPDDIDHDYLAGFSVFLSLLVVFNGFASLSFSMLRHQLKEMTFWQAILLSMKWLPFLILFFSGISLNCAKALLCHMFRIDIEWAGTAKEPTAGGFYIGLDKMVKEYKWFWVVCFMVSATMVYFACFAPWGWSITPGPGSTAVIAIVPLGVQVAGTVLVPILLGLN